MFPIMYLRRFAKAITPSAAIRRRRPIRRDWGISPPACRSNFRVGRRRVGFLRVHRMPPSTKWLAIAGPAVRQKIEVVTIVIPPCREIASDQRRGRYRCRRR
jgi:hypothetical protein